MLSQLQNITLRPKTLYSSPTDSQAESDWALQKHQSTKETEEPHSSTRVPARFSCRKPSDVYFEVSQDKIDSSAPTKQTGFNASSWSEGTAFTSCPYHHEQQRSTSQEMNTFPLSFPFDAALPIMPAQIVWLVQTKWAKLGSFCKFFSWGFQPSHSLAWLTRWLQKSLHQPKRATGTESRISSTSTKYETHPTACLTAPVTMGETPMVETLCSGPSGMPAASSEGAIAFPTKHLLDF